MSLPPVLVVAMVAGSLLVAVQLHVRLVGRIVGGVIVVAFDDSHGCFCCDRTE